MFIYYIVVFVGGGGAGGGGGGKKGKGRGGNGRGVRGVDFGLGIGYNPESSGSSNPSTNNVQSRSAAVNSLRTGMIAQFKNSFVAASSVAPPSQPPPSQGSNNSYSVPENKRPTLAGFVSGGSIGGGANSPAPPMSRANPYMPNAGEYSSQKNSDRLLNPSCLFVSTFTTICITLLLSIYSFGALYDLIAVLAIGHEKGRDALVGTDSA